jgi:hypothetical protein
MVYRVAENARAAGWPWNEGGYLGIKLEDDDGNETADARRLESALDDLSVELFRRGGTE